MSATRSQNAFETAGLVKQFKSVRALNDVSLQVPQGSIYGFLGPNGAGKSTLIRVLAGLIKPSAGSFSIFGVPDSAGHHVRDSMSALVDRADFYKNLSAYHNLQILGRLTGNATREEIEEMLQVVGLYERRHDKVKTYSQGMKQRLGLAQALLPRPRVLILDEPTTGLDPLGMREVRDFILKIADTQQVTIFLSSHLLHEVEEMCSHIGIIFNGEVATEGEIGTATGNLENVQISVESPALEELEHFLDNFEGVEELRSTATGFKLRLPYRRIPELIRAATQADIPLFSVAQRNRLEEYFLAKSREEPSP